MRMEPEKENWINEVMGSLDGLQRAEPNPFLFAKIRNRLVTRPVTTYVPTRTVWLTAASFVLLTVVNWQVYSRLTESSQADTSALNTVVSEMNLYPTTNQLYDVWSGQNY